MRRIGALLLALVFLVTLCACAEKQEPVQEPDQTQNQTPKGILSSFTAVDLQGNTVDQTVLQNARLTMVNVWATYCTPCIAEMPDLGELAEKYASQGLQIVGLLSDAQDPSGNVVASQVALAQDIVDQTGADYLHLVPASGLEYLMYQITAVPTTFFVDETGAQVGSAYLGAKSAADWTEIIEMLLEEVQ